MSTASRQFFFLVCRTYDESTQPVKCFLQEHEAITYGKRLATKEKDFNVGYELYRQEITRRGTFEFVKSLYQFERVPQGADYDIDTRRA